MFSRAVVILVVATSFASAQENRASGWRSDIDSLVQRIESTHPNPWRNVTRTAFVAEVRALKDSSALLSDGRMLTGVMRLLSRLGDGHTEVIDMGRAAKDVWFPVRFFLFTDGLWVTATDSSHGYAETFVPKRCNS